LFGMILCDAAHYEYLSALWDFWKLSENRVDWNRTPTLLYPIAFVNIPARSSRRNLSSRTKTRRKSAKILTRILHAFVMTQDFKVCSVRSGVWSIIVANCNIEWSKPQGRAERGKRKLWERESSSHDGFTFTGISLLRVFNAVTKECGSGS
jgi:hypothetical protein